MDAESIVEYSKTWKLVRNQTLVASGLRLVEADVSPHVLNSFFVSKESSKGLARLEQVTVSVSITASRRGDIEVELVSPAGYKSVLGTKRPYDSHSTGYSNWTFMSVVHW